MNRRAYTHEMPLETDPYIQDAARAGKGLEDPSTLVAEMADHRATERVEAEEERLNQRFLPLEYSNEQGRHINQITHYFDYPNRLRKELAQTRNAMTGGGVGLNLEFNRSGSFALGKRSRRI